MNSQTSTFATVCPIDGLVNPAIDITLGAGLGGMRPNIVVMGFYNLGELRQTQPYMGVPSPQPSRPVSRAAKYPLSKQTVRTTPKRQQTDNVKLSGLLPTDAMRPESAIGIQNYVTIVEDLVLRLQINVALAKGFHELEVPAPKPTKKQRALRLIGLNDDDDEEPSMFPFVTHILLFLRLPISIYLTMRATISFIANVHCLPLQINFTDSA